MHCNSNFFRSDYRTLGILKRQFPETPIMGVTATAIPRVRMPQPWKYWFLLSCRTFARSSRDNLSYLQQLLPLACWIRIDWCQSLQLRLVDELLCKAAHEPLAVVFCDVLNITTNACRLGVVLYSEKTTTTQMKTKKKIQKNIKKV